MNQSVIVRNEKGEISMQKVKVQRYISGKRPEYAQYDSSEDESDGEDFIDNKNKSSKIQIDRERYIFLEYYCHIFDSIKMMAPLSDDQ
jgi:hypothetical protein